MAVPSRADSVAAADLSGWRRHLADDVALDPSFACKHKHAKRR